MNHCEAAQDLLMQKVSEMKIYIALLAEHYKQLNGRPWKTGSTTNVVIWSCAKFCFQNAVNNSNPWFVAAPLDGINLYSCYAPPSFTISDYDVFLDW